MATPSPEAKAMSDAFQDAVRHTPSASPITNIGTAAIADDHTRL